MARPWLRIRGALTAALILFIHTRGWAGEVPCPRHSAEHHAVAAHHHGHSDHAQPGNGKPCTCMDDCPECQAIATAPQAPSLPESPILLTSGALASPPWVHFPSAVPHQLPLSTAPPVIG